ncbi:hypothetical protein PVAP13_8KG057720 [Panicum virgatum]|uniref:Uncharacterized protein n=1 Tax=Panicum virgatum TaxID=38727 RepID=A0A8T0PFJ0_PANVG|nr:hypothetical protein PVAP13_8KG057720 [Panicum virgatum]
MMLLGKLSCWHKSSKVTFEQIGQNKFEFCLHCGRHRNKLLDDGEG